MTTDQNGGIVMTAPQQQNNFSNKTKNPAAQILPMGMQPAILYSIVNTGTHDNDYQGKAKKQNVLKLSFEFPNHKQQWYLEDTELKPATLTQSYTYMLSRNKKTNKRSNLLQMVESLYGPISEAQYLTWNFAAMLDIRVFINVEHYTKQDGTIGAKISSISPLNPAFIDPNSLIRTNELAIYDIQMGFSNAHFAKLAYWLRTEIMESDEGKAHAQAGGQFYKIDENGNMVVDERAVSASNAAPVRELEWLATNYTYVQMKGAGWSDDDLVKNGYAKWKENVPVPAPAAPAPVAAMPIPQPAAPLPAQIPAPAIPTQPAPVAQVPAPAPAAPPVPQEPKLVPVVPGTDLNAFIAIGWTPQQLVDHNHARWEQPAPAPAPIIPTTPPVPDPAAPAPIAPAAPMAPAAPAAPMAPQVPQTAADAANLFAQTPAAPVAQVPAPAAPAPAMPAAPVAPAAPAAPMAPPTAFETPMPFQPSNMGGGEPEDLPF